MNHPRYLLASIIAQKDSASAFSHSLDPEETLTLLLSAAGEYLQSASGIGLQTDPIDHLNHSHNNNLQWGELMGKPVAYT